MAMTKRQRADRKADLKRRRDARHEQMHDAAEEYTDRGIKKHEAAKKKAARMRAYRHHQLLAKRALKLAEAGD